MQGLVCHSFPAALLGLIWLTMRTTVLAGSESMVSIGFPFAWLATDPSSSMAFTIARGAVLLDLAFWLALCHGLLALTTLRLPRAALAIALWLGAAVSATYVALSVSMSPNFVPWTLDGYFDPTAPRQHAFQFGPLPASAPDS